MLRWLIVAGVLLTPACDAEAQVLSPIEGALELLLPIGARGIGAAQAIVAGGKGSEAIWWNPSLIARGPREFAFNIADQANGLIAADASGAIVWPVPRLGAFALTIRYLSYGATPAADIEGQIVGSLTNTRFIAAGTFAAPFGSRLAGGITLKFLQLGANCTGTCDLPPATPRTAAVDFGVQYFLTKDSVISVGASGLNVGLKLQVNDSPQADQLPGRADVGLSVAPKLSQLPSDVRVRGEIDVLRRLTDSGYGMRVGGELAWQDRYFGRAGYQVNGFAGSGPTVGLGLATGKLRVDFAQVLTDAGAGAGKPTFLSLRYLF